MAFIVLGLLLLMGTFIFAQAIGQLFDSTLPPAVLMYAGFAALGIGWWYLPRARGLQIAVGAPVLLLAAGTGARPRSAGPRVLARIRIDCGG